jgi:beta-lactam-binding protein with PASTA domain
VVASNGVSLVATDPNAKRGITTGTVTSTEVGTAVKVKGAVLLVTSPIHVPAVWLYQEAKAVRNSARYNRTTAEVQVAQCGQMGEMWWKGSTQPSQIREIQHLQLGKLPQFRWNLASEAIVVQIQQCQVPCQCYTSRNCPRKCIVGNVELYQK